MATAYMADSINTSDLPTETVVPGTKNNVAVEYEAGYVNGSWPNATQNAKRFGSSKRLVSIDVNGGFPSADVLDVENGDATPATAPEWIEKRIAGGYNKEYLGVIYCNRGNITAVFNAMAAKGYKIGVHFRTWIATLDGTETVEDMTGVTAVQVYPAAGQDGPATSGHFDLSIVYDTTWKAPTAPPVAPPAPPAAAKTIKTVTIYFSDGSTETI